MESTVTGTGVVKHTDAQGTCSRPPNPQKVPQLQLPPSTIYCSITERYSSMTVRVTRHYPFVTFEYYMAMAFWFDICRIKSLLVDNGPLQTQ